MKYNLCCVLNPYVSCQKCDRKSGNSEKKWTGPPTTVGSNIGDNLNVTDTSPVPPFEHLTRGDLHTSCGKFWAFTGVQFPGSRDTLTTLIPTLHLPSISEENLARQINEKANYLHEKHNIKMMFILELDSDITASGKFSNADNKHRPLRVFRELTSHPPIYFQSAPSSAKEFSTQKQIAILRGFSSTAGIIEATIAAL